MILTWLRRLFGIDSLEREIQGFKDERWRLEKLVNELIDQVASYRLELSVRQKVMRDELMESEARLMTLIEEDTPPAVEPASDTLSDEEKKAGFTRWSERKRARTAAEADPSKWTRRIGNGNLPRSGGPKQDDVRGRDHQPGDGEAQAATGAKK